MVNDAASNSLEQQLETSQRDESDRSELQRKVNGLSEEVETVKQVRIRIGCQTALSYHNNGFIIGDHPVFAKILIERTPNKYYLKKHYTVR